MENFMNEFTKTALTSVGVIIPALIGYGIKYLIDRINAKHSAFEANISKKLYDDLFTKFHNSLETQLYKRIVKSEKTETNEINFSTLKNLLSELDSLIHSDIELFNYIDDYFLYHLSNTIKSLNTDLNKKNMKTLNKNYQVFSSCYFTLLNKVRKGQFIKPRSVQYRMLNSMHNSKNDKRFRLKQDVQPTIFLILFVLSTVILLPLLIALIAVSAKALISLIAQFYSIFSSHQ